MKLGAAGEAFFVERTRERFLRPGSPAASLTGGSPTTVPTDAPVVATDKAAGNDSIPKVPAPPLQIEEKQRASPDNVPDNLSIVSDKR